MLCGKLEDDHFAGGGKPMAEQPAPAQKPLGYIATMALNDLQDSIYGDVAVYGEDLADTVPIYTTPPAPAQPLTQDMVESCPYDAETLRGAYFDGWLKAEAAHGITKGGAE